MKTIKVVIASNLFCSVCMAQDVNSLQEKSWFQENWLWVIAIVVLILLIAILASSANTSKKVTSITKTTVQDGVTEIDEIKTEES